MAQQESLEIRVLNAVLGADRKVQSKDGTVSIAGTFNREVETPDLAVEGAEDMFAARALSKTLSCSQAPDPSKAISNVANAITATYRKHAREIGEDYEGTNVIAIVPRQSLALASHVTETDPGYGELPASVKAAMLEHALDNGGDPRKIKSDPIMHFEIKFRGLGENALLDFIDRYADEIRSSVIEKSAQI